MKDKMHKTNAMRLLDTAGVHYDVVRYEVDENDLSGIHAAHTMGADPDKVFKTLVLESPGRDYVVCCVPVAAEIDLKKAALVAGYKSLSMLPQKNLLSVSGYVRGGCSPLAMKRHFPTIIDETAILFDCIGVSGGERGLQLMVNPDDLARVLDARFAAICTT